jgi:hypothetical protein
VKEIFQLKRVFEEIFFSEEEPQGLVCRQSTKGKAGKHFSFSC